MTNFIDLIVTFYKTVLNMFDAVQFELGGYTVSLTAVIFVCIAFYMIISIYWRGAKG